MGQSKAFGVKLTERFRIVKAKEDTIMPEHHTIKKNKPVELKLHTSTSVSDGNG
jgi:hypothetical protein